MDQLENARGQSNTELGRSSFTVLTSCSIVSENHRLIPTGPSPQSRRNKFHVRTESLAVDEMLTHMLQYETPNPLWTFNTPSRILSWDARVEIWFL